MTLEDLVREVFPELKENSQRGVGEIYANCPFCEERDETRDARQRLGINYETGTWHCYNCGVGGINNPEWLFRELVRIFELDRAEYVFSWRGHIQQEKVRKKQQSITRISLPNEFEPLWEKSSERWHKKALKYLKSRAVSKEQIEEHFIGFCAVGKLAGRIVFPVYRKEEVVGWVARAFLDGVEPRYLNSEGSKYIWNAPDEKMRRGVLIEGVFDALAGERVFKKVHPMAGLGHDLTEEQLKPLLRFKELTLVPDPDKAGIKGTIKRARLILESKKHPQLYVVMPKEGSTYDWGKLGESSSGKRKIIKAFEERVLWSKYQEAKLRMRAACM